MGLCCLWSAGSQKDRVEALFQMVNPPDEAQEWITHSDGGWKQSLFTLFEISTKLAYESDQKEKRIDQKEYERIWKAMIESEAEGEFIGFKEALYETESKYSKEEFVNLMVKNPACNWVLDGEKIREKF